LAILAVATLLAALSIGVAEQTSNTHQDSPLDKIAAIAEGAVRFAAEAAEKAAIAGGKEAAELDQFLATAQAILDVVEGAQDEAASLAESTVAVLGQIHAIIAAIAAAAEEDETVATVVPAADEATRLASEAMAKAIAAAENAALTGVEAQALVEAVAHSMALPIAPAPGTEARQQASIAETALADTRTTAAQVTQAVKEGNLKRAVEALATTVESQKLVLEAARAAEAALSAIQGENTSLLGELRLAEKEVITAMWQTAAAAGEAFAALAIMERLVSAALAGRGENNEVVLLESRLPRATSPIVQESNLGELVFGNSEFAFNLYQAVRSQGGNLFYSPYSISQALAMTYAGARGETEQQMADTLHFTLPRERLHPTFNALDLELASRGKQVKVWEGEAFKLNIANSLWAQAGYSFLPSFLNVLAENYGSGLRLLDFASAPEDSRITINDWVSEETEDKIKDLLPSGSISPLTRLVLANAIYFNASWRQPFWEESTHDGTFYLLNGDQVTVPMMEQEANFSYAEDERYQAIELPYSDGSLSMVVLLPKAGSFEEFELSLDTELLDAILASLEYEYVHLTMPEFTVETTFSLREVLANMGMSNAFLPSVSDFSGMNGTQDLFIGAIVHKAFVSVDEAGTEAAAATAVVMVPTALPPTPIEVAINRPFIFMIRDIETEAILFMGRVMDPSESGS